MSTDFQNNSILFDVVDDQQAQSLAGGFSFLPIQTSFPLSIYIPFFKPGEGIQGSGEFNVLSGALSLMGTTKLSFGKFSINRMWSFMSGPAPV